MSLGQLAVGASTVAYLGAAHFVPLSVSSHGLRVQAVARLAWLVIFHAYLGWVRTTVVLPHYPGRKLLLIHIMISLYETIKFATVDLVRDPQPTVDDFFLSMAQAYTGAMLAAPLRRGIPSWTRATFQAATLLRPVVSGFALYHHSSLLHRASVHFTDAFLWSRLWVLVFYVTAGHWKFSYSYAWSIFMGAVLPIWTGALEMGLSVSIGAVLFYWMIVEVVMVFDNGNVLSAQENIKRAAQAIQSSAITNQSKADVEKPAVAQGAITPPLTPPPHALQLEFAPTALETSAKDAGAAAPTRPASAAVAAAIPRSSAWFKFKRFAASQGFTTLEHYIYLRSLKGDGKFWKDEYTKEDAFTDQAEAEGVLERLARG